MCGIVGAVSERNVEKILIEGLKRLEYRGYDSAGMAVITKNKKIKRLRTMGKVNVLENLLIHSPLHGNTGIAHTRWATHGEPSKNNAHPLVSYNKFALVHNGIIENHDKLRKFLLKNGYEFTSQTDTETIVHLLHFNFEKYQDLFVAILKTIKQLEGAYALGILSATNPGRLIGVRHGSPLVLGKGINENFLASDRLAIARVSRQFCYLEEGDIADLTTDSIKIYNSQGKLVNRKLKSSDVSFDAIERGEFKHYMSKEIFDQPQAVAACLEGRIDKTELLPSIFGLHSAKLFQQLQHIQFVACGTSYHAAMVARYWIESLIGIPCSVEIASEYRYRNAVVPKQTLFVTLSQSGETADTLAALRLAKKRGYLGTLAICNAAESSLVRESELNFMTRAGTEIGVASTKAFTTQLTALLMLMIAIGRQRNKSKKFENNLIMQLKKLPDLITKTLQLNPLIRQLAENFVEKEHILFLGRGELYPIALEGALKLKEISYIHAEGYPAGELKHGPLALVDKYMPVIALAPDNHLLEKVKSNLQEVQARNGMLYVFTSKPAEINAQGKNIQAIKMPTAESILDPIIYSIPMQLLAYHVAVLKGTDVDQPRNLAKSVTVE